MKGIHNRKNIQKINRLLVVLLILSMTMELFPVSAIMLRIRVASNSDIAKDSVMAVTQSQITTQDYSDLISIPDAWRDMGYPDSGNDIEIKKENRCIILNGQAVIFQLHGEKSALYLDANANGIVDNGTDLLVAEDGDEILGEGNRLVNYIIYGGGYSTMDRDICITVNSGKVGDIYGCFQCRTSGDITIRLNGGTVGSVYGVYAGTASDVIIYSNTDTNNITGLSGGCISGGLFVQLGQNASARQVIGVDATKMDSPITACCVTEDIEIKLVDNASCNLLSAAEVCNNVEVQIGGNVQVAITSLKGAQYIHGVVANGQTVVIGGSVIVDTAFCNFYDLILAQMCKQITGDACLTVKYDGDSFENISGSIYGVVTSNVYRNVNIHIQNDKNRHSLYAVIQETVIYGDADIVLQDAVVNLMEGIIQSVVYGDIRQTHTKVKELQNVYFIRKAQAGGNIAIDMERSEYCGYLVPMEQCQIAGDVDISSENCTFYGMLSKTNVVEGSETILHKNSTMTGQSVDGLVSDTISGDLTITLDGWQNGNYLTPVETDARIMGDSTIIISNSEIINAVSYYGTIVGNSVVTMNNCIAGELRFSGSVYHAEKLTIDEGYYGEIGKYNVVYGDNNISILGGIFNRNIQFGTRNNGYDGAVGDIQMEIEEGILNGSAAFVGNTNSPHNQVTIKVADSEKVVIGAGVTIGLRKDSDTLLEGGMLNNKGEVSVAGQYVCAEELTAKTVSILPDSCMILKNDLQVSRSFVNAGKLYVNTGMMNIPDDSERGAIYYPLSLQYDKDRCNPYGEGLDYLNMERETGYYALVTENNRIVPNPKRGYTVGQILFKRDTMQEFEQLKVDEEGGFSFSMEETPAQLQIVVELKQIEGTEEVSINDNDKVIDLEGHSVVLMSSEKGTGIYEDQNQDGVADTTVPICEGDYQQYTLYGIKDASYDKGVTITMLGGQLQRICGSQNAIIRNPGACVLSINMQAGKVDTITASEKSELEGRICVVQASNEKVDVNIGEDDISGSYLDNQGDIIIAGDYPLTGTIAGRNITLTETIHQTVGQSCSLIASDSITVNGELMVKGLLQTKKLVNQKGTIYHQGTIEAEEYVCSWDGTKTGCLFIQGGTVSGSDWKGVLYPIDCSDYNAEEMNLAYIHGAYRNGIALDSEEGTTYYGRSGYSQTCRYEVLEGYELQGFFSEEVEFTHDDYNLYWTMPMEEVHIKGICQPKQISVRENFNTPVLQLEKQYSIENPAISLSQWLTRVDDAKGDKAAYELVQGQKLPEGLAMDTSGRIYGTPEKEYPSGKTVDIEITGNNGTKVTHSFTIIVKKQPEEIVPIKDRIKVDTSSVQLNGVSVVIRGDENNNYIYADDDRDGLADTPDCVKVAQYYKRGYRYSYYGWYRQNAVGDIRITVEDGSVGNLTGAYDSTIDGEIDIYIGKNGFCSRTTGYSSGEVTKGFKITTGSTVTVGGNYTFTKETVLDEKTSLIVEQGAQVTIKKDVLLKLFCGYTDGLTNKGVLVNEGTLEIAGGMENNHTLTNNGVITVGGKLLNSSEDTIENNGSMFANNIVNNGTIYNWGRLEYEAGIQNNSVSSRIYTKDSLFCLNKPAIVPNTYYPMELYDGNEGGSSKFYRNAVNLGSTDKPSYYGKAGEEVQIRCQLDSQCSISQSATKIITGDGEYLTVSKVQEDIIAFVMPNEAVTAAVCYESAGIQLSTYEAKISEGKVGVSYSSDAPLYDMQTVKILQDEGEGSVSYTVSTMENNILPKGLRMTEDGKLIGIPELACANESVFITVTGRNGTTARFLLKFDIQKGTPLLTLEDGKKDYTGTAQRLEVAVDNVAESYNRSLITMNYYQKETGEQIEGEPIEPGKYLVVARAKADKNYGEAVSNTAILTINRAFAEKDIIVQNYQKTYDGSTLIPEVVSKQGAAVTYSQDQITYSTNAPAYQEAGNYRLYYRLQKEGYKDWNSYIQITIEKAEPMISVTPEYEWTGQAVALEYRISGVDKELDNKNCRVTYYSSGSDEVLKEVPREEGNYQVEILYNGNANYKLVSKKVDICIVKNLAEKNQKAVDEVEQKIKEIGSISYNQECRNRIEEAETAYNALTSAQKEMVSKSALLNLRIARELYQELEEEAFREEQEYQNQQAAERVIDMIYAMPKPDGSAEIDIQLKSIQLAYEELSEEQKQLIPARDWKYYEQQEEKQKEIKKQMETGTTTEQSTTEKPVSSETPPSSETPTSSEAPSSSETQPSSETPTSSEIQPSSEAPTSSEIPLSSEAPTSSETPPSSEASTSSETPPSSEASTSSETPPSGEVPTSSETPSSSEASTSSETPSSGETPMGSEAVANNNMQSSDNGESYSNKVIDTSVMTDEQGTGIFKIKQKGILYKVISEKGNKGMVAVQGTYKKNNKSVVIPATVRYKKKTYRVVQIAAGCFNKKKKLKRITIKSPYIKKIGKKAFGDLPAQTKIKVPKKQRKKYSKYIRKSGYKGIIV